ncbi:MAG TPA: hypothetical protein VGG62_10560 [Terracidiphilus sp.]|jgi:hypothetical protein
MPEFNQGLFNSAPFAGGIAPACKVKSRDLLYIAFREARILKRPQALNSDNELIDGLIFLNQQINYWAARGCYAWTTTFVEYTLTPGHQPHLIGPDLVAPDFQISVRPVRIESASIILPGPTPVDVTVTIRDNAWWSAKAAKGVSSNIPTDLYYEADYPNGQLWFWPVPTAADDVRLEGNVLLQQFATLDDCFIAPPAYLAAVTLTLAEELVDIWGTEMPGNLARRAIKARDALQVNNNLPPRIASADHGTWSNTGSDFNYVTGTIPNR